MTRKWSRSIFLSVLLVGTLGLSSCGEGEKQKYKLNSIWDCYKNTCVFNLSGGSYDNNYEYNPKDMTPPCPSGTGEINSSFTITKSGYFKAVVVYC